MHATTYICSGRFFLDVHLKVLHLALAKGVHMPQEGLVLSAGQFETLLKSR
jgi:hypothetical protein